MRSGIGFRNMRPSTTFRSKRPGFGSDKIHDWKFWKFRTLSTSTMQFPKFRLPLTSLINLGRLRCRLLPLSPLRVAPFRHAQHRKRTHKPEASQINRLFDADGGEYAIKGCSKCWRGGG